VEKKAIERLRAFRNKRNAREVENPSASWSRRAQAQGGKAS